MTEAEDRQAAALWPTDTPPNDGQRIIEPHPDGAATELVLIASNASFGIHALHRAIGACTSEGSANTLSSGNLQLLDKIRHQASEVVAGLSALIETSIQDRSDADDMAETEIRRRVYGPDMLPADE